MDWGPLGEKVWSLLTCFLAVLMLVKDHFSHQFAL